jgi:hypothetical protein
MKALFAFATFALTLASGGAMAQYYPSPSAPAVSPYAQPPVAPSPPAYL